MSLLHGSPTNFQRLETLSNDSSTGSEVLEKRAPSFDRDNDDMQPNKIRIVDGSSSIYLAQCVALKTQLAEKEVAQFFIALLLVDHWLYFQEALKDSQSRLEEYTIRLKQIEEKGPQGQERQPETAAAYQINFKPSRSLDATSLDWQLLQHQLQHYLENKVSTTNHEHISITPADKDKPQPPLHDGGASQIAKALAKEISNITDIFQTRLHEQADKGSALLQRTQVEVKCLISELEAVKEAARDLCAQLSTKVDATVTSKPDEYVQQEKEVENGPRKAIEFSPTSFLRNDANAQPCPQKQQDDRLLDWATELSVLEMELETMTRQQRSTTLTPEFSSHPGTIAALSAIRTMWPPSNKVCESGV
ncbi:hypothetical protein B0H11DRAFT_2232277 [Mycena galericulata]|nr:hypothetical protein B0H11DRAFT_2232277 [Mycena galericulata]